MAKQQQIEIHLLPQVVIHSRTYRASNIRLNGSGKKWAEVEYWTEGRGWREVHNWDKIEMVARILWDRREKS
ncbi:hypothetical protein HQN89_10745 [Paenibacillus frigoriresistens]|uniref:hypothetical protein n=1 Tax=Paenibacillus alginolyticus TaxID=59839 RepID=UPI001563FA2A|nr:hypothetical protein [Paenibacillus frigoriresistens]NRF91497.1 hypothetical protein [Paenibacillus frigoriresistens]